MNGHKRQDAGTIYVFKPLRMNWVVYAACLGKRADELDNAPGACIQDLDGSEIHESE